MGKRGWHRSLSRPVTFSLVCASFLCRSFLLQRPRLLGLHALELTSNLHCLSFWKLSSSPDSFKMSLSVFDATTWTYLLHYLNLNETVRLWIAGRSLGNVLKPIYNDLHLLQPDSRPLALASLIETLKLLSSRPQSLTISSLLHHPATTLDREVDWSFFAPTLQRLALTLETSSPLFWRFNPAAQLPNLTDLEINCTPSFDESVFKLPRNLTRLLLASGGDCTICPLSYDELLHLPTGLRVLEITNFAIEPEDSRPPLDWRHLPLEEVHIEMVITSPIAWSFLPPSITKLTAYIYWAEDDTLPPPLEGWNTLFPSLVSLRTHAASLVYDGNISAWNDFAANDPERRLTVKNFAAAFPASLRKLCCGFRSASLSLMFDPLIKRLHEVRHSLTSIFGLGSIIDLPNLTMFPSLTDLNHQFKSPTCSLNGFPNLKSLRCRSREKFSVSLTLKELLPMPSSLETLLCDSGSHLPITLSSENWPSSLTNLEMTLKTVVFQKFDLDMLPTSLKSLNLSKPNAESKLQVSGHLERFTNLKKLRLVLPSEDSFFSSITDLPSSLETLTIKDTINLSVFADPSRFTDLKSLKLLAEHVRPDSLRPTAGVDVALLMHLPRNLTSLEFSAHVSSAELTSDFFRSLPRSLLEIEIRNLREARWESESAACLAQLPKALQLIALHLGTLYQDCFRETMLQPGPQKKQKLHELFALPRDLLSCLPIRARFRTDDRDYNAAFKAMKEHWMMRERKAYFARWNLVWPTRLELAEEAEWRREYDYDSDGEPDLDFD